jgi:arsenite oxidase small subunit
LESDEKGKQKSSNNGGSRRNFLKLILTVGGLATIGSIASMFRILAFVPSPNSGLTTALAWPQVKIANISTLDPTKPLLFNYPLVETPSFLLKLGQKAENGVGPDGDIVAFSQVCQHLGCIFSVLPAGTTASCNTSYKASGPVGYCCCHGSIYDLAKGAQVIGGPAPRAQPMVTLRYDVSTGDIFAIGMSPPSIFGHGVPGTSDPASVLQNDLTGGTIVTDATVSVVTETVS